jgi:hypothetical protein
LFICYIIIEKNYKIPTFYKKNQKNQKESKLEDHDKIAFEKIKDMNIIIDKVPKFQSEFITKSENTLIDRAYRQIYDILIEE